MAEENQNPLGQELEYYSQTYGIYDQILSIQTLLTQISGIYVVTTGGLWTAVLSPELKLGTIPRLTILLLHLLASIWLIPLLVGFIGAAKLRFLELEKIQAELLPTIKGFGVESYSEAYPGWQQDWSWGKQRRIWFVFPVLGGCSSFLLLVFILVFPGALTAS